MCSKVIPSWKVQNGAHTHTYADDIIFLPLEVLKSVYSYSHRQQTDALPYISEDVPIDPLREIDEMHRILRNRRQPRQNEVSGDEIEDFGEDDVDVSRNDDARRRRRSERRKRGSRVRAFCYSGRTLLPRVDRRLARRRRSSSRRVLPQTPQSRISSSALQHQFAEEGLIPCRRNRRLVVFP